MNPLDAIGNQLNKGDFVVIQQGENMMVAIVRDIKEASSILTGPNTTQSRPGIITFALRDFVIPFDQQNFRLINIFKAVKPPQLDKPPS